MFKREVATPSMDHSHKSLTVFKTNLVIFEKYLACVLLDGGLCRLVLCVRVRVRAYVYHAQIIKII